MEFDFTEYFYSVYSKDGKVLYSLLNRIELKKYIFNKCLIIDPNEEFKIEHLEWLFTDIGNIRDFYKYDDLGNKILLDHEELCKLFGFDSNSIEYILYKRKKLLQKISKDPEAIEIIKNNIIKNLFEQANSGKKTIEFDIDDLISISTC